MMFDSRFDSVEQIDIHVGYDSVGRTGRTDSFDCDCQLLSFQ
jgi:hypothetical protein